jgi:hypothetical protein
VLVIRFFLAVLSDVALNANIPVLTTATANAGVHLSGSLLLLLDSLLLVGLVD